MKLKDFLTNSLFTEINGVQSFPFITGNEVLLDSMLTLNYGEREVYEPLSSLDIEMTAELLVLEFSKVWDNYVLAEEMLLQLHNEEETTSTKDVTENRTSNRSETEKVSGYDSPALVDNSGNTSDGSEDVLTDEKITLTKVDKNLDSAYNRISKQGKNNVIKQVLADVSSFLTIDIY